MLIFRWCIKIWRLQKKGESGHVTRATSQGIQDRDLLVFFHPLKMHSSRCFWLGEKHSFHPYMMKFFESFGVRDRCFFSYFRRVWGETPRRRGNAKLTARNPRRLSNDHYGVSNMEGLHELLDMVVGSLFSGGSKKSWDSWERWDFHVILMRLIAKMH